MFGSLSSCQPSSTVSTSFTSDKNQSLVVTGYSTSVVGPNVYYITATVSGYDVSTANGVVGYNNPTIHMVHGRTYKLFITSPNEPLYLTTTGGVTYTTGLRYVSSTPAPQVYKGSGGFNTIYSYTSGPRQWLLGLGVSPGASWVVWTKLAGATTWTLRTLGPDYFFDTVTIGAFNYYRLNVSIFLNSGSQVKVQDSKYTLTTSGISTNAYVVKVTGVQKTPITDFIIQAGTPDKLIFTYVPAATDIITVTTYEGQNGYILFTPTASTPSTLLYKSRVSPILSGTLSITSSGTVYAASSNIALKTQETVKVTLTTPATYLGNIIVEYTLDTLKNYFAVVNKNYYRPLIKVNDRTKKYYNYANFDSFVSVMLLNTNKELYVGSGGLGFNFGRAYMPLLKAHIILDVPNSTVHFINESAGTIKRSLEMPDFPLWYEKYTYSSGGVTRTDVFILCADGILYRINENLEYVNSQKFTPAVLNNTILDNLAINEDIPFKGSFTTAARRKLTSSLFPVVTSFINFENSSLWLVGTNQIAKVPITNISSPLSISVTPTDDLLNAVPYSPSGAIIITKFFDVFFIRNVGGALTSIPIPNHVTQITPGKPVLGVPCTMPFGAGYRVVIPDAHNQRLIFITNLVITFLPLTDFVPAYCRRFGNDIYVTGHDSNRVYRIETINSTSFDPLVFARVTYYDFENKVTVVSVVDDRMMAHHYLFDRTVLEFAGTGIKKIIPFQLDYREGPVGAIGTRPKTVVLLGDNPVTPYAGPFINWYTNGKIKGSIQTYDYIGVSYRASEAGIHTSVIIIGEHAIEYTTTTVNNEQVNDYRSTGVYGANFMPPYPAFNMFEVEPWDAVGNYVLPFYINFFGTLFNEFKIADNGVLSFDLGYNLFGVVPNFSTITANALLVEPRSIYLDAPIDNRIVSAVTKATLVGGKIPRVYYYSGVVGEFQFYKFKLIGTNPSPNPTGFNQKTILLEQTGTEFNFQSTAGLAVGQYVSNPITSPGPPYATIVSTGPLVGTPSVQITAVTTYSASVSGYYIAPSSNILYMTSALSVPLKKYANITASGGALKFGWYTGQSIDTYVSGNVVLDINYSTRTITVEGLINPLVTNKFVFDLQTDTLTTTKEGNVTYGFNTIISSNVPTTSLSTFYTCDSITLDVAPFSPILPKTANTFVQISKVDFDRLFVGQKLKSTLYSGEETIVSKRIENKTFRYTMSPRMGPEGMTIVGTLVTTNVNDGQVLNFQLLGSLSLADLDSTFTISYPGTAIPSYTIPQASTFSLPIYNNTVRISIGTIVDAIPGEFEDLKVRITNLDPSSSISLIAPSPGTTYGTVVKDDLVSTFFSPIIGSLLTVVPIYFMELSAPYTTATTDQFFTEVTKIVFSSAIPATANVNTVVTYTAGSDTVFGTSDDREITAVNTTTISYRRHELYSFFTESLPYCCIPTTWSLTGNFLTLSVSQTLPAETELLFKNFVNHFPIEYEVAFYVGRNFQFIEYNYRGQPEHDQTLTFGIRNADSTKNISISGTPIGVYSHLFGSSQITGELRSLGPGSFTPIPQNAYLPRYPRIFRERVFDDTTLRYDVYIDSKIISVGTSNAVGQAAFTTPGTYSWVAPVGVDYVSVVAIGGGGGGGVSTGGGGGGGLGWKNNIPVVSGTSYTVVVGAGGNGAPAVTAGAAGASSVGSPGENSYFISLTTVAGFGGGGGSATPAAGGTFFGDSGGNGGTGGVGGPYGGGGGGAGGYAGSGGNGGAGIAGGAPPANVGTSGSGGAGGGGGPNYGDTIANGNFASSGGAGGGVGIYGVGTSGSVGGGVGIGGGGGSGGASGANGLGVAFLTPRPGGAGALYGGGAGGSGLGAFGGTLGGVSGGHGAVRIIWGTGRAFPGTNTTDMTTTIATIPPARVSLDYGYLRINDTVYDGTWNIKEGDILSLFIPFKNNQATSSVVLSIAGTQYALPASANKLIVNKVEQVTTLPNQQKIENVQITLTVPVTGEYMIPDYFKSATGTGAAELIFERWVGGTYITNLARGAYHELGMGDEIIIKNLFTGYRDFNISEAILSGVQILRAQVRTINAPVLMNYVTFPVLDKPYTFQKTSGNLLVETTPIEFLNQPGFEVVANIGQFNPSLNNISFPTSGIDTEAFDLYRTRNIKVAVSGGTLGQPANLFVDNTTVKFIVNNVRTNSNYAKVVSGDDISLEYWVTSYFASNVKLYQITNDAFDSSNIYTEVGIWPISNRTIGDPLLINGTPGGGKSVQKITIVNGGLGYDRDLISVTIAPPPDGVAAEGYAVLNNSGTIVAIILTNGGSGYLIPPLVTINGPSTLAAFATSELVENLLSRESWLAIDFPEQFKHDATTEMPNSIAPKLDARPNNYYISAKQQAYKQNIEFPFFTGPMVVKFERNNYTYITQSISLKKESPITLLAGKSGTEVKKTVTFFSQSIGQKFTTVNQIQSPLLYETKPLKFDFMTSKLENRRRVISQGEIITSKMLSRFLIPITMFTGRLGQQLTGITTVIPAKRVWGRLISATLFTSKNGYIYQSFTPFRSILSPEYVKGVTVVTGRTQSQFDKATASLFGKIVPNPKPVAFGHMSSVLKANTRPVGFEVYRFNVSGQRVRPTLINTPAPKGEVISFVPYTKPIMGDFVKQVQAIRQSILGELQKNVPEIRAKNIGSYVQQGTDFMSNLSGKWANETKFYNLNEGRYEVSTEPLIGYNSQEYVAAATFFDEQLNSNYYQQTLDYWYNQSQHIPTGTDHIGSTYPYFAISDAREVQEYEWTLSPDGTQLGPPRSEFFAVANPVEHVVYEDTEQFTYTAIFPEKPPETIRPTDWSFLPEFNWSASGNTLDMPSVPEFLRNSWLTIERFENFVQNSMWLQNRFVEYIQNSMIQIPRFSEHLKNLPLLIERFNQYLQNSVMYRQVYMGYVLNPIFSSEIDAMMTQNSVIGNAVEIELEQLSALLNDISAELIFQDKLFKEFNPELLYQDKLFKEFNPELLYQDKMFIDFVPELLYQDKLFRDFVPELMYQDKLFREFGAEVPDSGNRNIILEADIADSGARLFEFEADIADSGARLFGFEADLADSGARPFDLNPAIADSGARPFDFRPELKQADDLIINQNFQLADPGNRYLDFLPQLIHDTSQYLMQEWQLNLPLNRYIDFRPELIRDGIFIPFPPEVLSGTPTIVPMDWIKFNPDVDYFQEDAFNQGAFQSNIRIVADDGRGGDYGQFTGVPPGTPGRQRLPLLTYRDFQGSALLSKTTTYGLGGFTNYNAAALVAAKYVSAGAFQIIGTNVWNYRIYFGRKEFRLRKSQIFPRLWFIKGA